MPNCPRRETPNCVPVAQATEFVDAFSQVVASLYDGPLRPEPVWLDCLEAVRTYFGANYAVLIFRPPSSDSLSLVAYSGVQVIPEVDQFYSNCYCALDPFVDLPLERAFTVQDFVGEETWLNSAFYKSFLSPMDVFHVMATDMRTSDGIDCRIRICRPRTAENFSPGDKQLCELLVPHIKRAVQLHSRQRETESTGQLFAAAIDRLLFGSIILDQHGTILHTNRVADEVLARRDGLSISGGRLRAQLEHENRALQALISESLAVRSLSNPSVLQALSISRTRADCPLGVVVKNLTSGTWAEGDRRASVAIFLRDPLRVAETSEAAIRRLFAFTGAEGSLAMLLAEGLTLDQAAERLHISRNTVRTHLRSLFAKTGTARQTDLVRVILGSVAVLC